MQLSTVLRWTATLSLAACLPVQGQFHLGKDKDKDKGEVLREKEQKREEKNLRTYEKIKNYSHDKYESDPDFRDSVDAAYRGLLREHMQEALERNLERGSYVLSVHEDRFREHTGLYDNLLVQAEVNRLGQRLVPQDSDRVFAFKLTPDPTPMARTLATGTIYISTGMAAVLDNEAQLAYVLAHEMAHVQLDHWKDLVMMQQGLDAYNVDQVKKNERIAVIGSLAGALTGGLATKSAVGAIGGALGGAVVGGVVGALVNRPAVVEWDRAQEDEADKLAFKAMLNANYDVREVPQLFATMESLASRDSRTTLGFLGERSRVHERRENIERLMQQAYKAEIEAATKRGFVGDTANHRNLMAELKRDNGIMAYYRDMFEVARKNLSEAVSIRDNDSEAEYFYGKTLETIGRTDDDHRLAVQCFQKAAQFDVRKRDFGARLHYAIALMQDQKHFDAKQVSAELDDYITAWFNYLPEERKANFLPPSLDSIYDYMAIYSPVTWQPKYPAELQALPADFTISPNRVQRAVPAIAEADALKSSSKSTATTAATKPAPPATPTSLKRVLTGR